MLETIVLSLTAFALILLNIKLNNNSTKEVNERKKVALEELNTEVYSPYYFPIETRSEREKELYKQGKEINTKIKEIEQTIDFINKKQDIINQRITSIENKVRKLNNNSTDNIIKKIEKLEDFKRNTIIELEALKQSIKKANETSIQLKKENTNLEEKIEKKIHGIVFHSRK